QRDGEIEWLVARAEVAAQGIFAAALHARDRSARLEAVAEFLAVRRGWQNLRVARRDSAGAEVEFMTRLVRLRLDSAASPGEPINLRESAEHDQNTDANAQRFGRHRLVLRPL